MSKNLKELAITIAASENPYAEFDKHASEMDETHTTTLSRELNRQLFLKGLGGSDLNADIEFGIIDSGADHGAVVSSGDSVQKTASDNSTASKSHLITDDMFLLARDDNKMIKMASYGSAESEQYLSIISDGFEKTASTQADSLNTLNQEKRLRATRELDGCDYEIIDTIIKTASHQGELRGALAILASNGREDLVEAVIMSSNYSMNDISEVTSDPIEKTASAYITALAETSSEAMLMMKDEDLDKAIEKVAFLGSLITAGSKAVGGVGRAIGGGIAKATGKAIIGTGKVAGKSALSLGKTIVKHPRAAMGAIGGSLLAVDMVGKAETNRAKIVDGLM